MYIWLLYIIITYYYYYYYLLLLFMGRARAQARPRPMCGGRGAVRPRGRGAVRRGPLREGPAHGVGPRPAHDK